MKRKTKKVGELVQKGEEGVYEMEKTEQVPAVFTRQDFHALVSKAVKTPAVKPAPKAK